MIKIGETLKEERKKKGITIEEVAKATKIRPEFITAIEKGDYSTLPSSAYAHGFVKNYISFLGLSSKNLLPIFRREFDEREHLGVLPKSFVNKEEIPISGRKWRRNVFFIILAVLIFAGFIFFQYRSAIFGPPLSIYAPVQNSVVSAQDVKVSGSTSPNATVTVNGQDVYVDDFGHFTKDISLFSGDEIITVISTNSYGKTTVAQRHVTVKQ